MVKLQYTLTEDEVIKYYEMILSSGKKTGTPRILTIIWGPALVLAVLIILRLLNWWSWWFLAVAVPLAIFWVVVPAPAIYAKTCRTAAKRKMDKENFKAREILFVDKDGKFTVNGKEKQLTTYAMYENLLVLAFADGENLIVPDRMLPQEDSSTKLLIRDIIKAYEKSSVEKEEKPKEVKKNDWNYLN